MARQIIQQIWCDACIKHAEDAGDEPVYVEGQEVNIVLGTMRMRTPAFCDVHMKEYIDDLDALLRDLPPAETAGTGPVVKPKVTESGQLMVPCQECGNTLRGKGSFGSHVRQMHGMTIPEYRAKYPDQDLGWPATGRFPKSRGPHPMPVQPDDDQLPYDSMPVEEVTESCDVCGWSTTQPPNRIRQMIGVHKAKKHGIRAAKK